MDSNPICHSSPAKKMKCLFLDYVKILMISWAGWWTWTPFATPLQPTKWNAHFWIMFNVWWSARLVNKLEPHLPALSNQKNECSFLDYVQLLMIAWAGQWTQTPSATSLQPEKWNAHFSITFNFWWSAGLVNRLKPHLPSLSNKKKWNTHFWITFNFWWSVGLFNGLEPHPTSPRQPKNEMLILGLRSTSDD